MEEAEFIERIRAARKKTTQYRLLLGLGVVGVFAWYGWGIYQAFAHFDERFLLRQLNSQAAAKVWPTLTHEIERLGVEVTPVLA